MPIILKMVQGIVAGPYNGILLSNKKKWTTEILNNKILSEISLKEKKDMLYYSFYMKSSNIQN